ncbi:MAG: xanthine dehydrogenase family protein subunit M [Gemmatimonadales bacterium]|nr:MAG: xanthine dehydrogenase family protein subunit M [Gemmatimonadales bacterium]
MKPAPFEYVRPASVVEAIAALTEGGFGAKPLAGGQSLIPAMNFRLAQPALLVDLGSLDELRGIRVQEDGALLIGAMTSHRDVERSDLVARHSPLLAEVMPWIAHPQIRNRGTLGGSLAHADPAAELPSVMQALGAVLHVRGPDGERTIPVDDFYYGLFTTALEPDELLVAVEISALPSGSRSAFEEISRRHGDFALAGVAVVVEPDENDAVKCARISLLSVGDGPVLAERAMASLAGRSLTPDAIREAARVTAEDLDPPGDIHASSEFRRHLAGVLTARALERIRM